MSTDLQPAKLPLPEHPNLRHLKDQAKDLFKSGEAMSITDAQRKIARLMGLRTGRSLKLTSNRSRNSGSSSRLSTPTTSFASRP